MTAGTVHLTFDFEECDLPREQGLDFPLADGLRVSSEGAEAVLEILARHGVKATFFCTLNFAKGCPGVMRRIVADGHEVAAHGVDHFRQVADDPLRCKEGLEQLLGVKVVGYRHPRMLPVDDKVLSAAGYRYNSSLNPAFVPGRYMHLMTPRTRFVKDGVLQIPASVTPLVRFPLFWLALHLLPESLYRLLVRRTLRHDGSFVTYFHPWEFSDELWRRADELKVPGVVRRNLGLPMRDRLNRLVSALKADGCEFCTLAQGITTKFRCRLPTDANSPFNI